MMKGIYFCFLFFALSFSIKAQTPSSALVPMVNQMDVHRGEKSFKFKSKTASIFVGHDSLLFSARRLVDMVHERMGVVLKFTDQESRSAVRLRLDTSLEGKEHYRIVVVYMVLVHLL